MGINSTTYDIFIGRARPQRYSIHNGRYFTRGLIWGSEPKSSDNKAWIVKACSLERQDNRHQPAVYISNLIALLYLHCYYLKVLLSPQNSIIVWPLERSRSMIAAEWLAAVIDLITLFGITIHSLKNRRQSRIDSGLIDFIIYCTSFVFTIHSLGKRGTLQTTFQFSWVRLLPG